MAQTSRLAKDFTLSRSASTLPKLIYGTAWKGERTADLVYLALKNGFRGVDTAAQPKHYNEQGVGQGIQKAIRDGLVRREELFIQTKFTPAFNPNEDMPYDMSAPLADKVHQSVQSSLRYFTIPGQEPYLDSVVMHCPMKTLEETLLVWETLESYIPHQIRNLGISNTSLQILRAVYERATIKPGVVQNRFVEESGYEGDMRVFCREKDIIFQSFWTWSANKTLSKSPPVKEVVQEAGVPLVAAYFSLVLGLEGLVILDGTTNEDHMRDDVKGIATVGIWAEGAGSEDWRDALSRFKSLIGQNF